MGVVARVAAVALATLIGVWALLCFSYHPHRCNAGVTAAHVGTTAAQATASDYGRLVRARRNLELLAGLRETCTTNVRVPMLIAANEELVGRPEDALRSYQHALSIDRRPEIYTARALVQLRLGKVDEAVKSYAAALSFSPYLIEAIESREIRRRVAERLRAR